MFSLLTLLPFMISLLWADATMPVFPHKGMVSRDMDSFYDPNIDYSKFPGRVTDRNKFGNILKIETENDNIKFFVIGDEVEFRISRTKNMPCLGHVRDIEEKHFVLFVQDLGACWGEEHYFRRGMRVNVQADILQKRVMEASKFRKILMKQRQDFFVQLNEVNRFIWSYDQEKVKLAASYDEQIYELQRIKQKGLDRLIMKKKEKIILQKELVDRLNSIDGNIKRYRVERKELLLDRWQLDHDLGHAMRKNPYQRRPEK